MTPLFPELPHPLGAYTLTRLIEQREQSELYAASQGSVSREVALEVLRSGASPEQQASFLATARKRVTADGLPHVGQVYESLCAGGLWFLTQELPQGRPLSSYTSEDTPSIADSCRIIAAAAELYAGCAAAGHAVLPLSASSVYVAENGSPRFLSPIVAGKPAAEDAAMPALAEMLAPLVPREVPGTARLDTLLYWMREGYEGQRLTFEQVQATAQTILTQLGEDTRPAEQTTAEGLRRRRRRLRRQVLMGAAYVAGVAALASAIASIGFLFRSPQFVTVPAVRADGVTLRLPQGQHLIIDRNPVSVADYAAFLADWEKADSTARERCMRAFEDMPNLIPADWETQLQGAPAKPVTGVTYRQAMAYAIFRGAELPAAAELQTVFETVGSASVAEWTADTFSRKECGLLRAGLPLALSPESPFAPLPLPDSEYAADTLGFRLARPVQGE
ncbi:MAG: SUMF1/EgtB/PvdO family nonheme iron enzyme [Akkermansia sp.]|nr:SUMF1/EgtB/PvdO family nonheme iron enzyme [Akkermansia sp.]